MKIGFDCDDILADYTLTLARDYNQQFGTAYRPEDITPLIGQWKMRFGSEMERQLWEITLRDEFCLSLPPVSGAVEWISRVRSLGHELYLVTGREKSPPEMTLRWLQSLFGNAFTKVLYSNSITGLTKGQIARQLGLDAFVDDIPYHILAVRDAGIPVIVLDYEWNKEVPEGDHLVRVGSWPEISSVLTRGIPPKSL